MAIEAVKHWVDRILGARNEEQVITTVAEYLATWTPSDIGEIPASAWPGQVSTKAEIMLAAVQAKMDELRYTLDDPAGVSLRELEEVLASASQRFGQLASPFRGPA
jgi:hypothetical protein